MTKTTKPSNSSKSSINEFIYTIIYRQMKEIMVVDTTEEDNLPEYLKAKPKKNYHNYDTFIAPSGNIEYAHGISLSPEIAEVINAVFGIFCGFILDIDGAEDMSDDALLNELKLNDDVSGMVARCILNKKYIDDIENIQESKQIYNNKIKSIAEYATNEILSAKIVKLFYTFIKSLVVNAAIIYRHQSNSATFINSIYSAINMTGIFSAVDDIKTQIGQDRINKMEEDKKKKLVKAK